MFQEMLRKTVHQSCNSSHRLYHFSLQQTYNTDDSVSSLVTCVDLLSSTKLEDNAIVSVRLVVGLCTRQLKKLMTDWEEIFRTSSHWAT